MFGKRSEVQRKLERYRELEAELDTLSKDLNLALDEKAELKRDIENLKLKKKIEEEDIKHMVKLKEEKQAVALQKKELDMELAKNKSIQDVKDEYQSKTEKQLEANVERMERMYKDILERLPNINTRLSIKQDD